MKLVNAPQAVENIRTSSALKNQVIHLHCQMLTSGSPSCGFLDQKSHSLGSKEARTGTRTYARLTNMFFFLGINAEECMTARVP